MNRCLFCNLSKFPDEQKIEVCSSLFVALALNPQTKGHLLVVPKTHFSDLKEIPVELMTLLISKVIEYGGILKTKFGAKAYVIKVNNQLYKLEKEGHIGHIHLHVIPRYKAGEIISENPSVAHKKSLESIQKQILMKGGDENGEIK